MRPGTPIGFRRSCDSCVRGYWQSTRRAGSVSRATIVVSGNALEAPWTRAKNVCESNDRVVNRLLFRDDCSNVNPPTHLDAAPARTTPCSPFTSKSPIHSVTTPPTATRKSATTKARTYTNKYTYIKTAHTPHRESISQNKRRKQNICRSAACTYIHYIHGCMHMDVDRKHTKTSHPLRIIYFPYYYPPPSLLRCFSKPTTSKK